MKRLLIANRGEIALRIARTASDMGLDTVAVFSRDDAEALHVTRCTRAAMLPGEGAPAYLDVEALIKAAAAQSCDALHPGYGFLSESPLLAEACTRAGITFIGPTPETLRLFGDKPAARTLAQKHGVPTLEGLPAPLSLEGARAFLDAQPSGCAIMLKAASGGGGRGMRRVATQAALDTAFERCQSEAVAAFGQSALYAERALDLARHIEVQIVGDGEAVTHLWGRECSLQRRHQKLIEIAPAPWLDPTIRERLLRAAVALGEAVQYRGIGTVEFLVGSEGEVAFIEVNPRLQVEHTVTEMITGLDLVQIQLSLAQGASLADLGLTTPPPTSGVAVQARVNTESLSQDGRLVPTSGRLDVFDLPSGPGVRVDTAAHTGFETNPRFDSLLAKIIVHSQTARVEDALRRADRTLGECRFEGLSTNLGLLRDLLANPELREGKLHTGFIDDLLAGLRQSDGLGPDTARGSVQLKAPMEGTIVQISAEVGQRVLPGQEVVVMSAMKMEHVISAPTHAVVAQIFVAAGQTVGADRPLCLLDAVASDGSEVVQAAQVDPDHIRPDLAEALSRRALTLDAARPEAVAKRHSRGMRTARENIADLCDPQSFIEYGALALPAQRATHSTDKLSARSPADGIVTGVGTVNAEMFGPGASRCAVLSYDYTVMAGTQGYQGHRKTDRLLRLAADAAMPVIFFTEGGGGRPNDTDLINTMVSGLECASFRELASLSGRVPLIGINNGRCFAGNAALLGCCDVIIATRSSNIGMGGPAMIEGGGLGHFKPEDIGPIEVQTRNGVVDVAVADEAEAVEVARRALGYFQGPAKTWESPDQRLLRHIIPENRLRHYEVREVLATLADTGSVLELRADHAPGMITALIRIEGRPLGVIANNPAFLAGAIDTPGALKSTRFMRLCNAFGLPILSLCDTPGIMVGPEAEMSGTVRAAASMFIEAARLDVPFGVIVLRKAYGLGAQAMAAGHFKAPHFTIAWPTGEFGPMGLEGAVRLGFRRQLEAAPDPGARQAMFEQMVELLYERGKGLNVASLFEIDDVIDPAESRAWILSMLT